MERKYLVNELLNNPKDYKKILNQAVACIVTKDEHKILTAYSRDNNVQGWERYKKANIKVFDLLNQLELRL